MGGGDNGCGNGLLGAASNKLLYSVNFFYSELYVSFILNLRICYLGNSVLMLLCLGMKVLFTSLNLSEQLHPAMLKLYKELLTRVVWCVDANTKLIT